MTDAPVAADLLQTLDIHGDLTSQVTFYHLSLIDDSGNFLYLIVGQVSYTGIRVNTCLCQDSVGRSSSDSVDIGKSTPAIRAMYVSSIYTINIFLIGMPV